MSISDEEKQKIDVAAKDRLTYHPPSSERPQPVPPTVESLSPEKKTEMATDITPPGNVESAASQSVSENAIRETALRVTEDSTDFTREFLAIKQNALGFHFAVKSRPDFPESYMRTKFNEQVNSIQLPIGDVGKPYLCQFTFDVPDVSFSAAPVLSPSLTNNGFSITVTGNTFVLTGIPKESVDDTIWFCFRNERMGDLRCDRPFLINADPRSLWQDLPVQPGDYDGYKNNDNISDGVEFGIEIAPEEKKGFIIRSSVPAKTSQMEIIMASKRGRSHAHAAKPRDDCFYYEIDEKNGWNFVAVADGAGSAKYSRKGSEIACHTVVKKLRELIGDYITSDSVLQFGEYKENFTGRMNDNQTWNPAWQQEFGEITKLDDIFVQAVYDAYMGIYNESQRRKEEKNEEVAVKDYHTTLLCAAFKYFGPKKNTDSKAPSGWFIASYWVGDGGAAVLRWNGTCRTLVLGEPDGGEFAGQTRFLTMKDEVTKEAIKRRLRFTFCDFFEALLLVTDGITDPFFPSESAVADEKRWLEFYEQKLKLGCPEEPNGCNVLDDASKSPKEKSESLLKWLDFWSKGNHDDRTVLIVKPK